MTISNLSFHQYQVKPHDMPSSNLPRGIPAPALEDRTMESGGTYSVMNIPHMASYVSTGTSIAPSINKKPDASSIGEGDEVCEERSKHLSLRGGGRCEGVGTWSYLLCLGCCGGLCNRGRV